MRRFVAMALVLAAAPAARADDRVDLSTTWFQEKREGNLGGLTIIHPQFNLGADLGSVLSIDLGYAADIVSGATPAVYSVDAVSSATKFDDTRHAGTVGIGFTGRRSKLSVSAAVATERDYNSIAVSAGGAIDLPGKNTNVALSYTHNFDEVCDYNNAMATPFARRPLGIEPCEKSSGLFGEDTELTVWRDLTIDTTQGTVTQNFTPTLVGQLSLYGSVLRGFQSNPYRRVRVSGIEAQETVPDTRARVALTARVNKFLLGPRASVGFMARGYSDTWGVDSATLELDYNQYVGGSLLLRFRARVYQQTAATFFKDAFYYDSEGPAGAYFTGDRELAPLRHAVTGAKITFIPGANDAGEVWGLFDEVLFNLKADFFFYQEIDADPDSSIFGAGTDNQFATSDGLLDAFTLQLGLLMRY